MWTINRLETQPRDGIIIQEEDVLYMRARARIYDSVPAGAGKRITAYHMVWASTPPT